MFFRKKKYDLSGVDRDSAVSNNSSSNRMSYASSASSGYSSGSGETLSRKKELRRLSAMSQMYDGSSARSSNSSLNRFSFAPSPDATPPEATRKQRICPVFEQGTPVRRTSSDFAGTTQEKISSNGCSLVQSSTDICSQTKSKAGDVPDKVTTTSSSSNNSQQRRSFDNQQQQQQQQQQQSKQETTQNSNNNNNMNFKQQPIKSSPTPGPTNIDDVMNSSQGLQSTQSSSSNLPPVLVTTPTEDNGNNNNNNNSSNNDTATSEALSVSQSSFSLPSSSNEGQMEIKSLRQLRRLAPKSAAPVTIKEDFSRSSSSSTTTATTTTASTASASNAAATLTTNLSASEPVIDFIAATVDLELESANKKQRSVTTINSLSSSSSENEHASSQATSTTTTFSESFPGSSEDSRHPRFESVPLTEPRISYPDETDAITTPTTPTINTFSITEIVDYPVIADLPSEFPEDVEDSNNITTNNNNNMTTSINNNNNNNINNNNNNNINNNINNNNMTTNIDEECQRDVQNIQLKSGCLDNAETKVEGNIEATKIYVGSAFTSNKPASHDDKSFLPGDENFKVDSNVYLQSNGVSRIIIKNDTIAITNAGEVAKDGSKDFIPSGANAFAESNQGPKLLHLFQTFDAEKVQTDADESEAERNGGFCDQRSGTTVKDSSVPVEIDTHVNSNDVDPVLDNIDHNIDLNTQVKGQHLLTPSPPPITDDQPADRGQPKHRAAIGKFKLNAGSNNFSTKPNNSHKSKSSKGGKDEEVENDRDYDYDDDYDDDDAGDDDDHEYFTRKKQETIEGRNGSFRGIRNLVKSGISTFVNKEESQFMKNLLEQSKGKIILFTTSMSVIRMTRDRCSDVKKILQNHRVYFEERDIYISDDNAKDLIQRFRIERLMSNSEGKPNSDDSSRCGNGHRPSGSDYSKAEYEEVLTKLPRVFVEDFDLGGYEKVFKLNETGVLKKIFKEFPKVEGDITCPGCGGFRYTPCHTCHGSKRSRSNAFTEEFFALRCTKCDENGLARCRLCNSDQTSGE